MLSDLGFPEPERHSIKVVKRYGLRFNSEAELARVILKSCARCKRRDTISRHYHNFIRLSRIPDEVALRITEPIADSEISFNLLHAA